MNLLIKGADISPKRCLLSKAPWTHEGISLPSSSFLTWKVYCFSLVPLWAQSFHPPPASSIRAASLLVHALHTSPPSGPWCLWKKTTPTVSQRSPWQAQHAINCKTLNTLWGTSLVVQWLRLHAASAGGMGSIPHRGTKISHAVKSGQKTKINEGDPIQKNPLIFSHHHPFSIFPYQLQVAHTPLPL